MANVAGVNSSRCSVARQRGLRWQEARHEGRFLESAYFGTAAALKKRSFHSPNSGRGCRTLAMLKAKTSYWKIAFLRNNLNVFTLLQKSLYGSRLTYCSP